MWETIRTAGPLLEGVLRQSMSDAIIVHYDEIATKRGNRAFFEKRLVRNMRDRCPGLSGTTIQRLHGRILVRSEEELDYANIAAGLREIPGLAWFSEVRRLPLEMEAVRKAVDELPIPEGPKTFSIDTRRAHKGFPLESREVNTDIGARFQGRTGWEVDLDAPDFTIHLDITPDGIFLYCGKERGLGGLPVGVSGKLIALMSGGLDSPVAAFKMFRRGCKVVFVHFHNYSPDAREVRQKVVQLVETLSRYQSRSRLYLVPFASLQQALVTVVPPEARMVSYRRVMLRIAEGILEEEGAKGFISGDSVGQVASQTLDNLNTIYSATRYPIFAPLIGETKLAITNLAKQIGTFETSIQPYDDCCTFLVAKHPETRLKQERAESYEQRFDLEKYCAEAREQAEVLEIGGGEKRKT